MKRPDDPRPNPPPPEPLYVVVDVWIKGHVLVPEYDYERLAIFEKLSETLSGLGFALNMKGRQKRHTRENLEAFIRHGLLDRTPP